MSIATAAGTTTLLDQLRSAFKLASPGVWTARSCVFKAHDRDFATIAHNTMPLMFEAVDRLKALHALLLESDPSYRLSTNGVTTDLLISELDGLAGQHPIVPVYFLMGAGTVAYSAMLSLTTGEVFVREDLRGQHPTEWIEPLTRTTGAAVSENADGKYTIDAQDLAEFRSLYGRADLSGEQQGSPEAESEEGL